MTPTKRGIESRISETEVDEGPYSLGRLFLANCRAAHGYPTGIALSAEEVEERLTGRIER